ncbi:preprotein translocase subunit SecY [Candidatus Gracilibacteria bacterium]|nr:preprotein translocase subunit SecY [Candidatus Gracilibacteria bacterium]
MNKLAQVFTTKSLRDKILFTIFILIIFRILAHITIPGADIEKIRFLLENKGQNALGIFSLLTGGAMENFSIILMGLTPYINASIILQLLTVIVPSLENLKKEGEQGQKKISQYTRLLTVPLAFVQSYGMMTLINKYSPGIVDTTDAAVILPMMLMVTAGTVVLIWLGELITEKGIGNGISLLIFAGIVSTVPQQIAGAFQSSSAPVILGLVVATILLTTFVVYVSEGERRVPVIYASKKSSATQKSFLPLKINQAGMIPIIFAISLVSFPSILAQFFIQSESATLQKIAEMSIEFFNPASPGLYYNILYALLIFGFTYFYVSLVFEPKKIADNIQKRSGFIPGYRPGKETEKFLEITTNRLCFWGGSFLAFVAIFPLIFTNWLGSGVALFISGAGIIIVVSVVLDLIRRINAQLVMQDYDKL